MRAGSTARSPSQFSRLVTSRNFVGCLSPANPQRRQTAARSAVFSRTSGYQSVRSAGHHRIPEPQGLGRPLDDIRPSEAGCARGRPLHPSVRRQSQHPGREPRVWPGRIVEDNNLHTQIKALRSAWRIPPSADMRPVPTKARSFPILRGTESSKTLCWREMDSNFRFRVPCKSGLSR